MTKFSIVIPLYNKEKDVYNTLQSVLKQTHINFEIIIINDGSTDNSLNVINGIKDSRIHVFSKENEGVSVARNYGVEKASSDFIAFLDADDYWYPNHLEVLNSMILKHPKSLWFATSYEKMRTKNLTSPMVTPIQNKDKNWIGEIDDFFENSIIDCLAWTSSICFKKEYYLSLKGFDIDISHGEDTDLWIRAALQSPLIYSKTITSIHNLTSFNRSSIVPSEQRKNLKFEKFEKEEAHHPTLKKYLDLNRYSLAIQYKIAGNKERLNFYVLKIDRRNLNSKQRTLLNLPGILLRFLIKFQGFLENIGIRLSSF